jgi:hypothetical protein
MTVTVHIDQNKEQADVASFNETSFHSGSVLFPDCGLGHFFINETMVIHPWICLPDPSLQG